MAVKAIGFISKWDQNLDSEGAPLSNGNVLVGCTFVVIELNQQLYLEVKDVDPTVSLPTLTSALEAAIQAYLEAEPYNIVFSGGDTVRMV
jgi:hypothetical protein